MFKISVNKADLYINKLIKVMRRNIVLFSLCLLIFIDSIGAGLIYSIMPQLFLDPTNGLILGEIDISRNTLYGLAFSIFSFASFFGIPILGTSSDRYGRKRVMLIALSGIITGNFLSIIAISMHSLIMFLIARAIQGFFSGTYVIANAIISDISTDVKKKLHNFRWGTFALVAGFTLGPFLGTLGSMLTTCCSLTVPFTVLLILAIINWILLFLFVRETLFVNQKMKSLRFLSVLKKSAALISNFKINAAQWLILGYIFFQFSFGLFLPFIGLFLTERYNYSPAEIGLFFISMGIAISISIVLLQPIINKCINYQKQLCLSLLLMGIILLIQALVLIISNFINFDSLSYILILSVAFFALLPLITTNFLTFFSESVSSREQGVIMGQMGQICAITALISSALIGCLIDINQIIIFGISGVGILFSYYFLHLHLKI